MACIKSRCACACCRRCAKVSGDYRYDTSDITRMWPVNGTFSPAQRALYGFVTEYHKTLLVTENGCDVLTKDTPLDLDAIEAMMKQPSLLESFPPF